MKEEQHKAMREITQYFSYSANCFLMAESPLDSSIPKLKMQMQQAIEDMKKSAKETTLTSNNINNQFFRSSLSEAR